MEPNNLELAAMIVARASLDGHDERLARSLTILAEKVGLTKTQIENALAPPPHGEYPVVYYP